MNTTGTRFAQPRRLFALVLAAALCGFSVANAAVSTYTCLLDGASEAPPNASPGTGFSIVDIDPVAHTMRVRITFSDLQGNTSASHIHGPTAVAFTGTAGVMTTTPSFSGFPLGVTAGVYDLLHDMTQASSYNAAFITSSGGTTATAEAAMFAAIAAGKAYVNVHSNLFPGGEIRGFLILGGPTPSASNSWGRIKSLYR
jgi:hypothetical protein